MRRISKIIERRCSVCGKKLKIIVYEDGSYSGGHYFGNLKDALIDIEGYDSNLPDEAYEYWECDECYYKGEEESL